MNIIHKIKTVSALLTASRVLAADAASGPRERSTHLYRRALEVLDAAKLLDEDLDLTGARLRLAMSYRAAVAAAQSTALRELMIRDLRDQLAQLQTAGAGQRCVYCHCADDDHDYPCGGDHR